MSIDTLVPSSQSSSPRSSTSSQHDTTVLSVTDVRQLASNVNQDNSNVDNNESTKSKRVRWAASSTSALTTYKKTLHVRDMSQEEINATWYSRDEFSAIKEEILLSAQVYREDQRLNYIRKSGQKRNDASSKSVVAPQDFVFCERGIEHVLSVRLGLRKKRRTQRVVGFVLEEQFRQATNATNPDGGDADNDGSEDEEDDSINSSSSFSAQVCFVNNDDCIAELYSDMSRQCSREAQVQGLRDQVSAGIIVDEDAKKKKSNESKSIISTPKRRMLARRRDENITKRKPNSHSSSDRLVGNVRLGLSRWREGSIGRCQK